MSPVAPTKDKHVFAPLPSVQTSHEFAVVVLAACTDAAASVVHRLVPSIAAATPLLEPLHVIPFASAIVARMRIHRPP
jgi:hypothetical protein